MAYTTSPISPTYRLSPLRQKVLDVRSSALGKTIRFGCVDGAQRAANLGALQAALQEAVTSKKKALYIPPGRIEVAPKIQNGQLIDPQTGKPVPLDAAGRPARINLITVDHDVTIIGAGEDATTIHFACGASAANSAPFAASFDHHALHVTPGTSLRVEQLTLEGPSLPPAPQTLPSPALPLSDMYGYNLATCIHHENDHPDRNAGVRLVRVRISGWFRNAIMMDNGTQSHAAGASKGTWLELFDCKISAFGVTIYSYGVNDTVGKRVHAYKTRFFLRRPTSVENAHGMHIFYVHPIVSLELVKCQLGADEESGVVEQGITQYSGGNPPTERPDAEYVRLIDCEFGRAIRLGIEMTKAPASPAEFRGCIFRSRTAVSLKGDRTAAIFSRCTFEQNYAGIGVHANDVRVQVFDCSFKDTLYTAISAGEQGNADQLLIQGSSFQKKNAGPIVSIGLGKSSLQVRQCQFRHDGANPDDWAISDEASGSLIVEQTEFFGGYAGIVTKAGFPKNVLLREIDTTQVSQGVGVRATGSGVLTGGENHFHPQHPIGVGSPAPTGTLWCCRGIQSIEIDSGVLTLNYDCDTYMVTGHKGFESDPKKNPNKVPPPPLRTIYMGDQNGTLAFGGVVRLILDAAPGVFADIWASGSAKNPLQIETIPKSGPSGNIAWVKRPDRYAGAHIVFARDPDDGYWYEVDEFPQLP